MTIVDTSAWSIHLRRRPAASLTASQVAVRDAVQRLSEGASVSVLGVVRQELLSGIREERAFERVRRLLGTYPNEQTFVEDYERAARFSNECARVGVASSTADVLICAVASRLDADVLTTDADFIRYARHLPVRIHPLSVPLS